METEQEDEELDGTIMKGYVYDDMTWYGNILNILSDFHILQTACVPRS